MILKRFAPKKSKHDLVDASGAHFKVAQGSKSGDRAAAKAIIIQPVMEPPLWILRYKNCHLGFALVAAFAAFGYFEVIPRGVYQIVFVFVLC